MAGHGGGAGGASHPQWPIADETLFLQGHPRVKRLTTNVLTVTRENLSRATEIWVLRYE